MYCDRCISERGEVVESNPSIKPHSQLLCPTCFGLQLRGVRKGFKPTRTQRSEGYLDLDCKKALPYIPALMNISASHGRVIARSVSEFNYNGNVYLQSYVVFNIIYNIGL